MKIKKIECLPLILGIREIYGGAAGFLEDCRTQKYFAPALTGMDMEDTGSVIQKLHQTRYGHPLTKAAIETALFDALGQFYRPDKPGLGVEVNGEKVRSQQSSAMLKF